MKKNLYMFIYCEKNINKPLVHFDKFSSSNLLELENLSTTFAGEFQADSG